MSPEALIEQFGYVAVFLGTILEGEAIVVAAGFFAARDYLDLYLVMVVAQAATRRERAMRRTSVLFIFLVCLSTLSSSDAVVATLSSTAGRPNG